MSLYITEEAYAYRKQDKEMLYHPNKSDNPTEILEFFSNIKDKQSGWIKTKWGYTHFTCHKDGKGAVFTSANFDETDKQYFYNLIGIESTNLLLRHH